jgi:sn-glycerol 3-phosphate transport system ATP-binding protein
MPAIHVESVSKRFVGGAMALDNVSLELGDREVLTVVGPSGCGKSTLLRIIAGLDSPTSGSIRLNGVAVENLPARERNVAMVFQSYALYPHMTCYENLALNLRLRKVPAAEIDRRVLETAAMLQITDLLAKRPRELSGGQRQRVAVGRALIRRPSAFLLDEPLSNLDALLRERVRHELKDLFRKVQAPVIYVTHDQTEAMTLADRVAVLDRGRLQQVGTPEELYQLPANRFVASFIGAPSMNLFDAELTNGVFSFAGTQVDTRIPFSGRATIGIRPEALRIEVGMKAPIAWIETLGAHFLVGLKFDETTLTALVRTRPVKDTLDVSMDPADIHVFDSNTGKNLRPARH